MSEAKRKAKSIGRIILLVLISLIIGSTVYSWNAETLAGNAMPMPFGFGISVVLSGSMEPELSVDDLVFVIKADDYKVGDVVVYQYGSSLVIHRIDTIDGDEIVTKGDDNDTKDDPISRAMIKGKAVGHIPFVGVAVRFLKSTLGTVLLIAAAIVLFELPYLQKRKKAEADKEKIKEEIRKLKEQNSDKT